MVNEPIWGEETRLDIESIKLHTQVNRVNMTNKPTWEIEFDKYFYRSKENTYHLLFPEMMGKQPCLEDFIRCTKNFISTKLAEQRKELITELNYTGVGKQEFNESTEHWKGRKQGVEEMKSLIINLTKQD